MASVNKKAVWEALVLALKMLPMLAIVILACGSPAILLAAWSGKWSEVARAFEIIAGIYAFTIAGAVTIGAAYGVGQLLLSIPPGTWLRNWYANLPIPDTSDPWD